jgi:glycosyltransferase involved in cell wall biosynthesis
LKILHITNNDYDGAGRAVISLHSALLKNGVDSNVAVAFSKNSYNKVFKISYGETKEQLLKDLISYKSILNLKKFLEIMFFLRIRFLEKFLIFFHKPKYLFNFNYGISRYKKLKKIVKEYDVIVLHSVQNIIRPDEIVKLNKDLKLKIVMRPLDMELITGGCHFNFSCNKWKESCDNCYQLKSQGVKNPSKKIFASKKLNYSKIPIHWVAPNNFIKKRLMESPLTTSEHKFSSIFLGIDENRSNRIEMSKARNELSLPINKKIILFGCFNFLDERKGAFPLKKTLCNYFNESDYEDVCLVTFGKKNGFSFESCSFEWKHFGMIYSDFVMNNIYRAADLLVSPSIDDLGPVIVQEAFMNELPIVAFKTGLASDLVIENVNGNLAECFDFDELGRLIKKNIMLDHKLNISNPTIDQLLKDCSAQAEAINFINECFMSYNSLK